MPDLEFYRKEMGISSTEELCSALCDTFLKTNRTYDFWVDWGKVARNSDDYAIQLRLLSTLRGKAKPAAYLKNLLKRHPEAAEAFPRLLAEHERRLTVLAANTQPFEYVDIDFSSLAC